MIEGRRREKGINPVDVTRLFASCEKSSSRFRFSNDPNAKHKTSMNEMMIYILHHLPSHYQCHHHYVVTPLSHAIVTCWHEDTYHGGYLTDALIQDTIRSSFKECTVITIAHHLNTIIDSNRIIVMENSSIVEFGCPYELLHDKSNGYFSQMMEKMGNQMAQSLLEQAKKACEKNNDHCELNLSILRTTDSKKEAGEIEAFIAFGLGFLLGKNPIKFCHNRNYYVALGPNMRVRLTTIVEDSAYRTYGARAARSGNGLAGAQRHLSLDTRDGKPTCSGRLGHALRIISVPAEYQSADKNLPNT
ncbi:Putative multidrug resistance-associated protein lethal(2)03659 [Acromyrmex echinatior]|uniref:Putative multidrug resistance-associated protein lethal(2)03659 n=1 Tax=Acromyrmex echinatior TaxID=103372 RepID=F4WLR9_ACREC|nr:Putative multidrug resistance-associated protein lethal(2)03659 [Acromyrmex echinatior]